MRAARVALLPALLPALLGACAQQSSEYAARYAAWEEAALAQGLLRTETAPPDATYSNAELARNFELIALHREFPTTNGPTGNPSEIHKWRGEVEWAAYGDPEPSDIEKIESLTKRLTPLTGLAFRQVRNGGDIRIFFLDEGQRHRLAQALRAEGKLDEDTLLAAWLTRDDQLCVGLVGHEDPELGGYSNHALIGIPTEVSDLMRASCVDEEFVQALGLFNDHPGVRPSIFNDDEEFALLTEHDEYLIRILYDPRLTPGMSAEEAMPIVKRIIAEIRPGDVGFPTPSGAAPALAMRY